MENWRIFGKDVLDSRICEEGLVQVLNFKSLKTILNLEGSKCLKIMKISKWRIQTQKDVELDALAEASFRKLLALESRSVYKL